MLTASSDNLSQPVTRSKDSTIAVEGYDAQSHFVNPSVAPETFWQQFFAPFQGCCAFTSAADDVKRLDQQYAESENYEAEMLRDVSRHHPETLVALAILKDPPAKANVLLASGRLPVGIEVAGRLEEQLRAVMLGDNSASRDDLNRDLTLAKRAMRATVRGGALRLVGNMSSSSTEEVSVTTNCPAATVCMPSRDTLPLVCLLDILLSDIIRYYSDMAISLVTTTIKPLLLCRGTSKHLGALWWLLEVTRSSRQTGQLLCTLSRKILLFDLMARQTTTTGTQKALRYQESPSFPVLCTTHTELNALTLVKSLTVRDAGDVVSDWNMSLETSGEATFIVIKRGSMVLAAACIPQGEATVFMIYEAGSASIPSLKTALRRKDEDSQPYKATNNITVKGLPLPDPIGDWSFRDPSIAITHQRTTCEKYISTLFVQDPDKTNSQLPSQCLFLRAKGVYVKESKTVGTLDEATGSADTADGKFGAAYMKRRMLSLTDKGIDQAVE